jgi:hypothetical protein
METTTQKLESLRDTLKIYKDLLKKNTPLNDNEKITPQDFITLLNITKSQVTKCMLTKPIYSCLLS